MSTYEDVDSLIVELECGIDLKDLTGRRGSEDPTSDGYKGEEQIKQ